MRRKILYIFLFLVGIFSSCQDIYNPEIDEYPDALVVEGILTDQNDYVTIKLTRSAGFKESSYFASERKATVEVHSVGGLTYSTTEITAGNYQTNEPVQTTVGEGYFVKIVTSRGEEYQSSVEAMMKPCSIDSIYLTDSIFREVTYNYWGEPVVEDYKGITFSVLPREPEGERVGFLYKWNALINYGVTSSQSMSSFSYHCWDEMVSNSIYVYDYYHDELINELPVGELHALSYYTLGPLPIDSTRFQGTIDGIYLSSMYYHLKQYAITKEGASYWRSVKNQSEASGKLFDPVEEQIIGNIRCVSDSNKVAFGYFNVASFSDMVVVAKLNRDTIGVRKIVEFIPKAPSDEDCFLNIYPDFWF